MTPPWKAELPPGGDGSRVTPSAIMLVEAYLNARDELHRLVDHIPEPDVAAARKIPGFGDRPRGTRAVNGTL